MPIADPATYREMIAAAAEGRYALASVNVSSSSAVNGVLSGLADAGADGIVSIGLSGARFAAGADRDPARGAAALAAFVHAVADAYPINVALHTDHCPPDRLGSFVEPLVAVSARRVACGDLPLFGSHMFDGSHLPLADNLARSRALLGDLAPLGILLELEIGLVGGVEDEIDNRRAAPERLVTPPEDMAAVVESLGAPQGAGYLVAAAFGNVHGIEVPAGVELDPEVLGRGQAMVARRHGPTARLPLVFHGGSGCTDAEIRAAVAHGVVKMNLDTDTQYAYTRGALAALDRERDRILTDGDRLPAKSAFELSSWSEAGERSLAGRVAEACAVLGSAGRTLAR